VPRSALRLVSYNVRYFGHALKGLASTRSSQRRIAARLAGLEPLADVICLQEIETDSVRSSVALRGDRRRETQLEAFMDEVEAAFAATGRKSPYEGFYFRAHVTRLRGVALASAGLAILVNGTRVAVHGHNVAAPHPITHHHVERFRDRKQARVCAHMTLQTPAGGRLHVFNTHLSLPTPFARGFWERPRRMGWGSNQLEEARTLAAFVRRSAGEEPFVVGGDFNSAPGSPVYRFLTEEQGFVSPQERLGLCDPARPDDFATAGFFALRMHLDHVFCGNGVAFLDLEGTRPFGARGAPFHGLSDHVPLIGRFRVG
jgi:endonuclease/exonuclease/phosphatase family metal-dependent hydrolase